MKLDALHCTYNTETTFAYRYKNKFNLYSVHIYSRPKFVTNKQQNFGIGVHIFLIFSFYSSIILKIHVKYVLMLHLCNYVNAVA